MPPVSRKRVEKQYSVMAVPRSSVLLRIALLSVLALLTPSGDLFAQTTNSRHKMRLERSSVRSSEVHLARFGRIAISATLPQASVGVAFNAVLSVSGGSSPYQFAVGGGMLPPGLSLDAQTGRISGTPLVAGTYQFKVVATDLPKAEYGDKRLSLAVDQPSSGGSTVSVAISPTSATLSSGGSYQFTATVSDSSNVGVTWSASAGTMSTNGLFVAPQALVSTPVIVNATSTADPSKQSAATVTVLPVATQPAITTNAVPSATVGRSYVTVLQASGGTSPYTWSLASGALPQGLQLDGATGTISGTPAQSGNFSFGANLTDSASQSDTRALTLSVSAPVQQTGFDGPAELPRVFIQSSLAATPAPGKTIAVNAGGDFQAALNSANCGDTVSLQAGAVFTGAYTLPAKSCDDNNWIIIRTSAPDSSLPPEGTRLTPCYAGVASLPGRPDFNCVSTNNVLAQIKMVATSGSGPIRFAPGANHYRLLGLEITRQAAAPIVYALVSVLNSGAADQIVFDRVWIHGTAHDDTTRGIALGGGTRVAVVDSFFTDFHCEAMGTCTDSQAIWGGVGSLPMGPYKIVNNFLEAAAETVLFGGGGATVTPTDIELRHNHMFKPMIWMKGQPGFVGGPGGNPFIVKNHFELKNAQRVLFEGNILENTWGGFSQVGFSILLTPKSQSSACPICQVTDVTIRYSTISHVGSGLQIANALSATGGAPLDGGRYSIHDLTVDDIGGAAYFGSGIFAQVGTGFGAPMLHDVSIQHITAFPPTSLFIMGNGGDGQQMPNFTFANSIVKSGLYPVWSLGGTTNCAAADIPLTTLNSCFNPYSFAGNVVIGSKSQYIWPAGTFLPADTTPVQFVNYNLGNGGDYHLQSSSPYKNAGSDGKDLGADVDAILAAIAGAQ
jgi:hypothetical protein